MAPQSPTIDADAQAWLDQNRPGSGPLAVALQVKPRPYAYGMFVGILIPLVAAVVAEATGVLHQPGAATVIALALMAPIAFVCVRIAVVFAWPRWKRTIGRRPPKDMVIVVTSAEVFLLAEPLGRSETYEYVWHAPRSEVGATSARRLAALKLRTPNGTVRLTHPRMYKPGAALLVSELQTPPGPVHPAT